MNLNIAISFLAGLATFFSPCVLPVVPGYIAILSADRSRTVRRAIFFTLGLALSFTVLGALVAWVGGAIVPFRDTLFKILGLVLVVMGINLVRPLPIPFLRRDLQVRIEKSSSTDWGAALLGGAFGLAWTPCTGVILGAIIGQALLVQTSAVPLLLTYSLGLITPMILLAIFLERTGRSFHLPALVNLYYGLTIGLLIILFGLGLLTGGLDNLRGWLLSVSPDFEKGLLPFTR